MARLLKMQRCENVITTLELQEAEERQISCHDAAKRGPFRSCFCPTFQSYDPDCLMNKSGDPTTWSDRIRHLFFSFSLSAPMPCRFSLQYLDGTLLLSAFRTGFYDMVDCYSEEAVLGGRSEQQGTLELEFGFLEIREREREKRFDVFQLRRAMLGKNNSLHHNSHTVVPE